MICLCYKIVACTYSILSIMRLSRSRAKLTRKIITRSSLALVFTIVIYNLTTHLTPIILKYTTAINASYNQAVYDSDLILQNIEIEGNHYVTSEQIITATNLHPSTDHITDIPLSRVLETIMNMDWIKHATVTRILPNKIKINIIEYKPLIILHKNEKDWILSIDHTLLPILKENRQERLITIRGEHSAEHIEDLLYNLDKLEIKEDITSAEWIGNRRWNITYKNRVILKLSEQNYHEELGTILKMDKSLNLLNGELIMIDLRVPGKTYYK